LASDGSFLVEDFLEAITAQLDRTQDALRIKAVNRPLTYAIREFNLDLKVFVEMDKEGNVRFRSGGANEEGASTVRIGFTTMTRPMVEENTVSMAETSSPSLDELGLHGEERKKLERMGVRNATQLRRLKASAGAPTMARLSGVPLERLRSALDRSKPQVRSITPVNPQRPLSPSLPPQKTIDDKVNRLAHNPVLRLSPNAQSLELGGSNLLSDGVPPDIRLNGLSLPIDSAEDHRIVAHLPHGAQAGVLEVETSEGDRQIYDVTLHPEANDPWSPTARDNH
jgi:hypothetical protein